MFLKPQKNTYHFTKFKTMKTLVDAIKNDNGIVTMNIANNN